MKCNTHVSSGEYELDNIKYSRWVKEKSNEIIFYVVLFYVPNNNFTLIEINCCYLFEFNWTINLSQLGNQYFFIIILFHFSISEIFRYAERMKTLSKKFNDRPMSPKDTVLYWTEYILKHNGTNHLRTAGADMSFYQYFLLDVILFIVTISFVILCTLYMIKRIISAFCFSYYT